MAVSASDMTPQALAALLSFYADSGVEDLCEDAAIDRFEQSAALAQSRTQGKPQRELTGAPASSGQQGQRSSAPAVRPGATVAAQPMTPAPQASQLTIPGEAAFEDARALAASATTIAELRAALDGFTGCNLRHSAKTLVFADGNPDADVMFIGEAPGREEDIQGAPFVGRAGQLLDRMLSAIGLSRDTAYITNMIPWRPPGNRTPAPHEIELCRPFIERHVALAAPKIVVMLGNVASKSLLGTDKGILSLRGTWMEYLAGEARIPALPTLHPAYLLRNPAQKRLVWADLLSLQERIEQLKAG
ncbi:MAG: uracil-DNA glycosylase [Hoeflea sp.]|uniref:uracil-DNA glycosylase n=1 Tax=Hoeflea sp. TaxID=1940281 RepID=UPI001DA1600E|nr:uracil-DNA glycosylase [Hoeflea sp.]MBU4530137.1 uracil-DNA glycosylase [Alphaproteobacteria bacterium]MBU4542578.1 uracil-DNA glycosylase [Alphaproteobacteria bacterium]MBU4551259.1 uracil-DNA glycosylase [Alphaproteobacteria bacterium]MBV1723082.1 uracil-DNA glycosylase [Hoeflea sp.]MBV1760093.1 uracil-DNA glycosylase [Hoeflea sp.]